MKSNALIFIFLLSVSCSPSLEDDDSFLYQIVDVAIDYSKDFHFISDTMFIPLEFCEDCIIGDISKVIKVENGFIISDKTHSKRVYKFDEAGNFLFGIGTNGSGLGNYVLPFDFSIVPQTNRLAILDQNQGKMLYFDLRDGSFIEEFRIYFQPKSMFFLDSSVVAFHLDGNFMATEIDTMGAILDLNTNEFTYKGVIDYTKTDQNSTRGDFFMGTNDLLFSKPLNDTIYLVNKTGFTPKYVFDFGEKKVPEYLKKLSGMEMFQEMAKIVPFYHNGNVLENDTYLFFNWWANDEVENFSVFDKTSNRSYHYRGDDLIFKHPFYVTDEYMLCYLTNNDYDRLGREAGLGFSENQVIIKVKFAR